MFLCYIFFLNVGWLTLADHLNIENDNYCNSVTLNKKGENLVDVGW